MQPSLRDKLEVAMYNGVLSLDGDTDSQEEEVETIISILAADSATDGVRRLADINRKVLRCHCGTDESYQSYVRRFEGIASEFLKQCPLDGVIHSSKIFTMIMLQNAHVPALFLTR